MVSHDPLIGREIDGYRIEELLGHGGMGRVYRGLDIKLKRYAAIKVLEANPRDRKKYEPRFNREAQAIAKLKHPNIVSVYRFNDSNNIFYMAMEYIDGADLRWVLHSYANDGVFVDYKTILNIIEQLGSALDYAHQNGVIHRDVKPSNVMISRDGKAILTDFGLALDTKEGSVGEIFGSPHYIAPEQAINSAQAVPQTDLYSLGIILYEMLTGSIPFDEGSAVQIAMAHISTPLPDPRTVNPDLHEAFIPVLEKILDKEPKERYQTGAALVQALRGAIREAEQSRHIPEKTSLIKPTERIAQNKIPLPKPVVTEETKSPTVMASLHETKFLSPQEGGRQKRRNPLGLIAAIFILIIVATAAYFFSQGYLPNFISGNAVSSGEINAVIEGQVEAVETGGGWLSMQIYGLSIRIPRSHPLYETVQVGDIVMIEGHYVNDNGSYRFDTIANAQVNGEILETPSPEGN